MLELGPRDRAVRREVPVDELLQRVQAVVVRESAEPDVRAHERDVPTARRPVAQLTVRGRDEVAPRVPGEPLAEPAADQLTDLGPSARLAEPGDPRFPHPPGLGERQLLPPEPLVGAPPRLVDRLPEREVLRRLQMERASDRVALDELPRLPEQGGT